MMLTEQVFAQSLLLVGELEQHQMELLRIDQMSLEDL